MTKPDKTDAMALADELRAVVNGAADMLERLDEANTEIRSAASGVLPDGTPVEDMLADLKYAKAEITRLHHLMREISFHANRKAVERADALVMIREILSR